MDMIINFKTPNTMTNTIEVKHTVPTTVHTSEITLPFYFRVGKHVPHYCCMQVDGNLVDVSFHGGYYTVQVTPHDEVHEVADRLEREFSEKEYAQIDEAVFMHKFSQAQREIFYIVNPQLKPMQ
jgi:hypothetical protein